MYFSPGMSCLCCILVFYLLECISFVGPPPPEEIISVLTKMPRHNLNKTSKSPFLKISFLVICLFLSHCSFAEKGKGEDEVLKESKPDLVEIRLSSMEKELRDQKTKMSVLEATRLNGVEEELEAQKKKLSTLETKQESQFNQIQDDISILKRKQIDLNNNKHKREVSSSSVAKEPSTKYCSDSSRLCTFFYPDNPDAIIKSTNDGSSYNKIMQEVFNSKAVMISASLNHPPTSCKELKQIGHTLNGFYLVQDTREHPNQVLTVYCNFTEESKSLGKLIGKVDLKTKTVHFYVQKKQSMMFNGILSFEVERLNVGGAMNLASGVFTAPVTGTYHFDFSAIKDGSSDYVVIDLQVNDIGYGRAHTAAGKSNTVASLTASLRLKAGDRVVLNNLSGGKIFENPFHHTHFAGWLVDEELAL